MWATLRDMYTGLRSSVKVGSEVSSEYAVEQGLMEGAILSPFLYTVFIDGLTQRLEAQNLGCRFTHGGWAGALYYADDLCMMATSDSEMQKMLRVLDEYCRDWQFQPAYSKTKVLRYGGCRQNKTELFLPSMHHETKPGAEPVVVDQGAGTDSNPVAEAEEYKYLGVVFQTDRKFSKHAKTVVAAGVRTAGFQLRRYHVVPQGLGMAANSKVFGAAARGVLRVNMGTGAGAGGIHQRGLECATDKRENNRDGVHARSADGSGGHGTRAQECHIQPVAYTPSVLGMV